MEELQQIGPRIRADVAEALREYCRKRRMSMSVVVELAIIDLLRAAGEQINDHRD
jgi:hypothetical protein